MVHAEPRCPTIESSGVYRSHATAALLCAAALLDSTSLEIESADCGAGDVGDLDIGCDGRYLCLVAASGTAAVPADVCGVDEAVGDHGRED